MNQTLVESIVFEAIDVHNQLYPERHLERSAATPLFGTAASLDSMMLVNLLLEVEDRLMVQANRKIALADTRAFSPKSSPFRDVRSLVDFICAQNVERTAVP